MIILLIFNNVFEMNVFQKIESENVIVAKILYQMLFDSKKKTFIKTIYELLNHNNDKFINQTRSYFLT